MTTTTHVHDDDGSHASRSTASHSAKQHHVEIATLSLPSKATGSGVQSGDGSSFILEAPSHVIDQLVESDAQFHQHQFQPKINQTKVQQPPQGASIEGVVDLEYVSHLVAGLTEEEFVSLLHQEAGGGRGAHMESVEEEDGSGDGGDSGSDIEKQDVRTKNSSQIVMDTIDEGKIASHSDSPKGNKNDLELVRGSRDFRDSGSKETSGSVDECQPLLRVSTIDTGTETTATGRILLSADPFVQTIVQLDSNAEADDDHTASIGSFRMSEIDFRVGDGLKEGIAISHEAFLLSVPTTEFLGEGNLGGKGVDEMAGSLYSSCAPKENIFVLALPEMAVPHKGTLTTGADHEDEHTIVSTSTFLTHTTSLAHRAATAAETIGLDHAFAPLPTDVRHIELRVSTIPVDLEELELDGVSVAGGHPTKFSESQAQLQEVHLDVVIDRKVPLIGYIILVAGLLSLSSVGVALEWQQGSTPEMKSFWRFSATAFVFLAPASKCFTAEQFSKFTWMELFVWMPFAGMNYSFMCTAFVVALEMTSLVNAFILSNMASLIIIGSKFALGSPVLLFEGVGALIGFIGALICASAGASSSDSTDEVPDEPLIETHGFFDRAMVGNILAFLASVATAIYLSVAKQLRPKADLFLFMFILYTVAALSVLAYMVCIGQNVSFDFHPETGVFGWLQWRIDRIVDELFMAIICNGVGTTGYVAIMKYFDPVVVTMVMLMEPVVATLMGVAAGVTEMPGLLTWVGDVVVAIGSILVISSGSKKKESIDATDALQTLEDHALDGESLGSGLMRSPKLKRSLMSSPGNFRFRESRGSAKSPLLRKSHLGVTKSPLIVMKSAQVAKDLDHDEVEFTSVSGKHRAMSLGGGEGRKVVWK